MQQAKQKRMLDKMEKDTYKVRRAEGRPKHGQTSFTVLGLGIVAWFCLIIALVLPEWRSNYIGIMGYPHSRSWGLFKVVGMSSKMHHEAMTDQCRFYSQLNVAGVCASPVCLWYRKKCQVGMDLTMVSYTAGGAFFVCLVLHTLTLIWTTRMTPRLLRWAAIWWVVQVVIHVSVTIFWWLMSKEAFNALDTESLYPMPDMSFCFYLECFVVIVLFVISTMGVTLMKMWPEESSSGSDEDSDEDDSDDADPKAGGDYGPPQGPHSMMGPPGGPAMMPPLGGQPMMPPPGGAPMMPPPGGAPMMQAPMGFAPNMGPPQMGGPPNMGPPGGQPMGPPGSAPPPGDFGIGAAGQNGYMG